MQIGMIGLGRMGGNMTIRLVQHGHQVVAYDRNREAVDAAFLEELEALTMQNPRFTLIPTITRLTYSAWHHEVGRINPQLLSRYLTGLNSPVFYIAGPSGMVTAMTDLLRSLDVSDDDIKTEEFGDYAATDDPVQRNQVSKR